MVFIKGESVWNGVHPAYETKKKEGELKFAFFFKSFQLQLRDSEVLTERGYVR